MASTIAVDIGGTFTDLVGMDEATGAVFSAKASSTPGDLAVGIRRCLERIAAPAADIAILVHGSTVAINTVIERTGARTALVVTRGTRDVYGIGRGNRPDAYDLFFKRPVPLVPRHLTFEVDERMGPHGTAWTPLDPASAADAARRAAGASVEAVAVCFLHAWSNPAHEAAMGAALARTLPDAYTSLSHEILREYGEYERISTTVLNAYVGPVVARYLTALEGMLEAIGFGGRLLIMQSNGGVMSPDVARRIPVATMESGPVGGFIAAALAGGRLGYRNVIGLDMGGTTAKTNLVRDGEPQMAHGYHIGGASSGQAMMLPVVDTVEIGSGGGSIASVTDEGGLEVGPRSAGAVPGPACYGLGGREPTVTDANLVLGRLDAAEFLGGEMPLDAAAAREAVERRIAARLGGTAVEAALAIVRIAVMKMSLAVRQVSVERGCDPRDFALVVFGGAGPLHGVEVARELHIPTVIVPAYPGQFSAAGMLAADLRHDFVRTAVGPLQGAELDALRVFAEELVAVGRGRLLEERVPEERIRCQRYLELRYEGQDFAIPIPVTAEQLAAGQAAAIRGAFDATHRLRFGYDDPARPLEIVNVRVAAVGARERREVPRLGVAAAGAPRAGVRPVILDEGERPVQCPIYRRDRLGAGQAIAGPAVIHEYASTTVLFRGDVARVAETGDLVIAVRTGA